MKPRILIMCLRGWTSENWTCSIRKSPKNMPTMQINLLTLQITENPKKYPTVSPTGVPKSTKNHKKSTMGPQGVLLLHPCTIWWPKWCQSRLQGPKMEPKWSTRDPKRRQKSWKLNNNLRKHTIHVFEFWTAFNPANPSNPPSPPNPSSLQITNLLVGRGAGDRGQALR